MCMLQLEAGNDLIPSDTQDYVRFEESTTR